MRILPFAAVLPLIFACEDSNLALEPSATDDEFLLVSQTTTFDAFSRAPATDPALAYGGVNDSSLSIRYGRLEEIESGTVLITEQFLFTLRHPLEQGLALDYGAVDLSGVQLTPEGTSSTPLGTTILYSSIVENGTESTGPQPWNDAFRLEQRPVFVASGSSVIEDLSTTLLTDVPNGFLGRGPALTIDSETDLLLTFRRTATPGTIVTIGSDSTHIFYHFELVRASQSVSLPASYLKSTLGSNADIPCTLGLTEHLQIGTLISNSQDDSVEYRLPVYEFTIHRIETRLNRAGVSDLSGTVD